mmetsp:Transcript_3203/g.8207  ORF Transcript_3203/g.8207 Transcript_3203/m.8207 type:complete len:156 (+) Transcript_3203:498-965(+)
MRRVPPRSVQTARRASPRVTNSTFEPYSGSLTDRDPARADLDEFRAIFDPDSRPTTRGTSRGNSRGNSRGTVRQSEPLFSSPPLASLEEAPRGLTALRTFQQSLVDTIVTKRLYKDKDLEEAFAAAMAAHPELDQTAMRAAIDEIKTDLNMDVAA